MAAFQVFMYGRFWVFTEAYPQYRLTASSAARKIKFILLTSRKKLPSLRNLRTRLWLGTGDPPSIGHRGKFWELGGPVDLSGLLRGRGTFAHNTRRTDGWVLIPTSRRKTRD
jgi:hypothetical protein